MDLYKRKREVVRIAFLKSGVWSETSLVKGEAPLCEGCANSGSQFQTGTAGQRRNSILQYTNYISGIPV